MTTKYRDWYSQIIENAQNRIIPTCYTEVHHIKPRALGGGDEDTNLVRLTYREHFLVHWLLVRICTGPDLRPMLRALCAMSLPGKGGNRIVSGWQFDAAKRANRDLELYPDEAAESAFRAKQIEIHQAKAARIEEWRRRGRPVAGEQNRKEVEQIVSRTQKFRRDDLRKLTSQFLKDNKRYSKGASRLRVNVPRDF